MTHLRWGPAFLLGLATIGAYGTAYYAIGVLLPVIEAAEGWDRSLLAGTFSAGLLAQGVVAIAAGRLFDRYGSMAILLPSLLIGCTLLFGASLVQKPWHFAIFWTAGACIIGGGLYYNVTMPVATRLYPDNRTGALSVLTLLGALASPIFYPLAGIMVDLWGWQGAVRGLVLTTLALGAPAALLVRAGPAPKGQAGKRKPSLARVLAEAPVHRFLLVVALAGLANSALVLHQVPTMQAAGLSIAAASSFAGLRGAFQIPGRLLLTPLTRLAGVSGSIRFCYLIASTAAAALLVAILLESPTGIVLVAYFCIAGGISLGLLSPLNGLYQSQVFGDERLGTLSGISIFVSSVASATGAMLSAVAIEQTGSYIAGLGLIIFLQLTAIAALFWQTKAVGTEGLRGIESPLPLTTH